MNKQWIAKKLKSFTQGFLIYFLLVYVFCFVLSIYLIVFKSHYQNAISLLVFSNLGLLVVLYLYSFLMKQVIYFEINDKEIYFLLLNDREYEIDFQMITEIHESSQRLVFILSDNKSVSITKRFIENERLLALRNLVVSETLSRVRRKNTLY